MRVLHRPRAEAIEDASRRDFLRCTALAMPGLMLMGCTWRSGPSKNGAAGYRFLTTGEAEFVRTAVARLIPADELGPGALEAGVDVFIDAQLAGDYGCAGSWYMQGPWRMGTEQQGYQLPLTPAQLYRAAIPQVDAYCSKTHGDRFAKLAPELQDEVLHALQDGKVPMQAMPAKTFFTQLWQNTQEGFLADPVYGGNRDFAGWKLIGFPGPRYNYVDTIGRFGQPYDQPYVSLGGRNPVMEG